MVLGTDFSYALQFPKLSEIISDYKLKIPNSGNHVFLRNNGLNTVL